jgi:serine/threonine-protein kinase PknG
VLTARMPSENGIYEPGLPTPEEEPLFDQYEFFYRLLLHATNPDPEHRFTSAAEMAGQLNGVLREILAQQTGEPRPSLSTLFSPPRTTFGTDQAVQQTDVYVDGRVRDMHVDAQEVVAALSVPLIDPNDPAANVLTVTAHSDPREILDAIRKIKTQSLELFDEEDTPRPSMEIPLAEIRASLDLGEPEHALMLLDDFTARFGESWRTHWYSGFAALLRGEFAEAFGQFELVLDALPGEAAPKVALAATAELVL